MKINVQLILLLLPVALLTGCASTRNCATDLSTARDAASNRLPTGVWLQDIPQSCHDQATAAWAEILKQDCAPLYGFHAGANGLKLPARCQVNEVTAAWNMGHEIASMESEYSKVRLKLAESRITPTQRRDLQSRRITIERDLPELRALARMEGFLAAAAPESPWLDLDSLL